MAKTRLIRIVYDSDVKDLKRQRNELGKTHKTQKNLTSETRNYGNVATSTSKKASSSFLNLKSVIGGISFLVLIGQLRKVVNTTASFERQMSKLRAISRSTDGQMLVLERDNRRLGETTRFTAAEVAKLQIEFAKLGFTTQQIINATEATLALASVADTDLANAAEVAGSTLKGLGLEAAETNRVVDVLALSFSSSGLDIENFRESMKLVAPIARAANIPLETATALLAKLADSGLKGSIAGTGLKNVLSKLSNETSPLAKEIGFAVKNSDDLIKAFEALTEKNIDLTAATELTDERSKAAFLTLVEGTDQIKSLTTEFENANGAALEMAKIMEDNLIGDWHKFNSAIEGLVLGEGSNVNKLFRDWIQSLTKLASLMRGQEKDIIELFEEYNRLTEKLEVSLIPEDIDKDVERVKELRDVLKTLPVEVLQAEIEKLERRLNIYQLTSEEQLHIIQLQKQLQNIIDDQNIDENIDDNDDLNKVTEKQSGLLEKLVDQLKAVRDARKAALTEEEITRRNKEIELIKAEIKRLEELGSAINELATPEKLKNIQKLRKELEKMFEVVFGEDQDKIADEASDRLLKRVEREFKIIQDNEEKKREEYEKTAQRRQEIENRAKDILFDLAEQLLINSLTNNQAALDDLEKRKNRELELAGDNAEARNAIQKKFAQERERVEKNLAEEERKRALKIIAIQTAVGIAKAFATYPWPESLVPAAFIAAEGAAQAVVVQNQQFEKGGYTGDGYVKDVAGYVHKREYVIPAKQTAKSRRLLEDIQAEKLDDKTYDKLMGLTLKSDPPYQFSDERIVKAIKSQQPPDFIRINNQIYEVRKSGSARKERIRRKILS